MRTLCSCVLGLALMAGLAGCTKPKTPTLTGVGMFHDITAVKQGMSANEVRRVMGSNSKTVYEEGILGIDGGNYIWEYAEGRIYFNYQGVTRVQPF